MKKHLVTIAALLSVGLIAGCGGGGGGSVNATSTTISGKIADGYLSGAEVFLDKNVNYQWDSGEPKTTTDGNGAYSMNVSTEDAAMYPIVARAVAGVTIDMDTNTAVTSSYVMSAPAGFKGFISPMSTLIREKMAANPGMTMNDAMTQLRNQMNLPAGADMMSDFVAGSRPGMNAAQSLTMHTIAQQMAGLMAAEAPLVINGSGVNQNRYRSMMATINSNMSAIAANVTNGQGMDSTFMTGMMSQMQAQLGAMPMGGGFANYSGMFRNMTSSRYFWNTSGGTMTPTTPMSCGMMK